MITRVSMDRRLVAMICVVVTGAVTSTATAGGVGLSVGVTADENGHGTITVIGGGSVPMPFALTPDTSPGGLPSALRYDLLSPPGLVLGDLIIADVAGGPISDVIRFTLTPNGGGVFFFYSADIGGGALADVGLPTTPPGTNTAFGVEFDLGGGVMGYIYHPTPNQPGAVPGFDVTYTFISDVPAPGAAAVLGLGGLLAARRRRS